MWLRLAIGLVFIVVPVLELMLLIKIGQRIGALATVALVLGTALTGAFLISRQSMAVVTRTLEAASQGQPPVAPVLDGLFLMVAGALLLTPGLLTDVLALALLVPPVRRWVARACMHWVLHRADIRLRTSTRGDAGAPHERPTSPDLGPELRDGPIIDGEFERVDERAAPRRHNGRPASRA